MSHEKYSDPLAQLRRKNPKQARFVEEYLVDLNGTQAAIRAGYSAKTADVQASQLLAKLKVQQAIQTAIAQRSEKVGIAQEDVLRELGRIGFANMLDFIRVLPDGLACVDLRALTREQAAAIKEITVDEYVEGRGENARLIKSVKIKMNEKIAALELLGRHLGMFLKGAVGSAENPIMVVPPTHVYLPDNGRDRPEED